MKGKEGGTSCRVVCPPKYNKRRIPLGIQARSTRIISVSIRLVISMTESGNPKENAEAERLNNTIKNELLCNGSIAQTPHTFQFSFPVLFFEKMDELTKKIPS